MKKQREEFDQAKIFIEELNARINEMEDDHAKLRHTANEAEMRANHLTRENKRLSGAISDLSRQVSFL